MTKMFNMLTEEEEYTIIRNLADKLIHITVWQGTGRWTLAELITVADPVGAEGGMKAATVAERIVRAIVRLLDERQSVTDMLDHQRARQDATRPHGDDAVSERLARGIVRLMDANGWRVIQAVTDD